MTRFYTRRASDALRVMHRVDFGEQVLVKAYLVQKKGSKIEFVRQRKLVQESVKTKQHVWFVGTQKAEDVALAEIRQRGDQKNLRKFIAGEKKRKERMYELLKQECD